MRRIASLTDMLPSFEEVVDKGKELVEDNFWIRLDTHEQSDLIAHKMLEKPEVCVNLSKSDNVEANCETVSVTEGYSESNCLTISIYSGVMVALVCLFVFICRDYVKYLLLYLDDINMIWSFLIFMLLFTIVSFPLTWGYVLLNVAAGYLYGFIVGIINVVLSAFVGVAIAHCTMRYFLQALILKRFSSKSVIAFLRILDGENSFKVVALSRLTPIPFGLQNALFAVAHVNNFSYLFASTLGMLPTQCLNAYLGSTIRSMEEVISSASSSKVAYLLLIAQLIATVVLVMIMARKAKTELDRALLNVDKSQLAKPNVSSLTGSNKPPSRQLTDIVIN